jgi:ABC-2 type transport system ATP-binding protein
VTGLVGPDGAGKTTLMRMLAGLLKPMKAPPACSASTRSDDSALHAMLGYMPQKFGLYEDLTVMENLNLYADLRSVTGETAGKPSPACWNLPPSARSPTGWRASSPAG